MGCRDFAELYMKVVNAIVLSMSVVILGYGAFLAASVGDSLKDIELNDPVIVTVIFGAVMFLFSLMGILGTCWDNKCLLFIYIIGCLVLSLGILASGVALLFYGGYLDDIKNGDVSAEVQETIQNFELAAFEKCCGETAAICADNSNVQPCVTDQQQFEKFSQAVGSKTCSILEKAGIVGPESDGKCGGGNDAQFVQDCTNFFKENLTKLAIANITVGVILILMLGTSCALLWTKDDDERK